MGDDARSAGGQSVNESTPAVQRRTDIPQELDAGPKVGEKGEYRPATYVTRKGIIRQDR